MYASQAHDDPGHTSRSITVDNLIRANTHLNQENAQLRSELAHAVVNYGLRGNAAQEWRQKFDEMHARYMQDMQDMIGRLQVAHYSIGKLTADVMERDQQIQSLVDQKNEIKRSYKANLKRVAKHLTTRLQEQTEKVERLTREINELLAVSGAHLQTRNDSSQTESTEPDFFHSADYDHDFPRLFGDTNSQNSD